MAGLPLFELTREILLPRLSQLGDDFRMLRREPVLQFIECLHRSKHSSRNFKDSGFHESDLSIPYYIESSLAMHGVTALPPREFLHMLRQP